MILEDVQSRPDLRGIPLDEVGISGLRHPIMVCDRTQGKQETVAQVSMSVSLPARVKGAHLSRFVEILSRHAGEITLQAIPRILAEVRDRLATEYARVAFAFPYFMERVAPVSGARALMDYQCHLTGELNRSRTSVMLAVGVPVTSVCPCSKAISDYGAHNQRSTITISVRVRTGEDGEPEEIWVEELIDAAERSASAPVFPLLKRSDERHVTMLAYDNPVFVEDIARHVASDLRRDTRLQWFRVEVISEESIHNHSAFARVEQHLAADEGGR